MTLTIEPRLSDLVHWLYGRVNLLYPGFRAIDYTERMGTGLSVLAQLGLAHQHPDGRWEETTALSEDFDHVARLLHITLEPQDVDFLKKLLRDRVILGFVESNSFQGTTTEDNINKHARGDDLSYEEAFGRAFRISYPKVLGILGSFWELHRKGRLARQENCDGGLWALTPWAFFAGANFNKKQSALCVELAKLGFLRRDKRGSRKWRLTSDGKVAGFASKDQPLRDVLERIGIDLGKYA